MKKYILISLCLLACFESWSQAGRFKGVSYGQVQAGFSDVGMMVSGRFVHNYQNQLAGEFGVGITRGRLADVILTTIMADGIASFNIYHNGRVLYLNTIFGITLAGDFLNDFKSEKLTKRSFFTYGIMGGLEAELLVSRKLSFILSGSQRHYFRSTFDEKTKWRFDAGAGIRISL